MILTNDSITGTSTNTPTTTAKVTPECTPKRIMATATANSKKLLDPINAEGAASANGIRSLFVPKYPTAKIRYV